MDRRGPCAWAIAHACSTNRAASRGGCGRPPSLSASVPPSTYSSTSTACPCHSRTSYTVTMCGWCNRAAARASVRTRLAGTSANSTFTATGRCAACCQPR
ncbi:MAG: hypothetical protein U0736_23350 [Gemmataceae bacterium]